MKLFSRILLLLACSITTLPAVTKAQISSGIITNTLTGNTLRGADNLKTGNYLDVLSSFLQLGFNDLTGNNKAFNFRSTLFALRSKAGPNLTVDTTLVKHIKERNLQLEFSLNLDDSYKINGFTGGITYALVNGRDKALANFSHEKIANYDAAYSDLLRQFSLQYVRTHLTGDNAKDSILRRRMATGILYYAETSKTDSLPPGFLSQFGNSGNLLTLRTKIDHDYDSLMNKVSGKPLWTASVNGTTNNFKSAFNAASFETIFLNGNKYQADVRARLSYGDSIPAITSNRLLLNAKGGVNIQVVSNNTKESVIEFKPHFEYSHIYKGAYLNEKPDTFSANGDLRIRVTDKLWLPLTVKYDITNNNVLGFLNIAFNVDAFKNSLTN